MNADGKMTRIFKKEYYIFRKEKIVLQSIKESPQTIKSEGI